MKRRTKPFAISIDTYRTIVDKHLLRTYGVTWADACGDVAPLQAARDAGERPEDFVSRYGRKHDLIPKAELGL